MTNLLDKLWISTKAKAGICSSSTNIDDLREYLKKGEDYSRYAAGISRFVSISTEAPKIFRDGADALGKVRTALKTANDVLAARQIADAICILNGWVSKPPTRSDAEAARAFDQIFGGAAQFAKKLPPPLSMYAKILSEISKNSFFEKMRNLMENYNLTDSKQLKSIMDEDDALFRPLKP